MKVDKIDHVGINVWDMEKAVKFFGDLFETEFGPLIILEPTPMDLTERMGPLGLDIAEPGAPDKEAARILKHKGEGLNGLSIKVSNLEEAVAEMKARGIREIWRGEYNKGGVTFKAVGFHPKDTFGVMIELTEHEGDLHPLMTGRRDDVVRVKLQMPSSD